MKALFAFLDHLAYDLEGLAAGAGQIEKRRGFDQRRVAYGESAMKALFAFLDELTYDMCL
jgi:hypothetical protein